MRVDIFEDMIVRAFAVGDILLRVRVSDRCLTCGLLAFGVDSEELQIGDRDGMCCDGLCDEGNVMVELPLSMEGIVETMEVPSERRGGDGVCDRDSASREYRSLAAEFRVVVEMVLVDSLDCCPIVLGDSIVPLAFIRSRCGEALTTTVLHMVSTKKNSWMRCELAVYR